jgi:SAM-dependent methyltransferase
MTSDEGEFWDRRYLREGAIWGDGPSPTALLTAGHLPPRARVLEVGFGYGRDLLFLLRRRCRASGIELSIEGRRQAEACLRCRGLEAEGLLRGRFEDTDLPAGAFDAVLSHRLAHLLETPEAIARFAAKAAEVLRPGGILAVGARNRRDLNPAVMVRVEDGVYEYADRPGHRVRYWEEATFREAFGQSFRILTLDEAVEQESLARPVPCQLTVMIAVKKPNPKPVRAQP